MSVQGRNRYVLKNSLFNRDARAIFNVKTWSPHPKTDTWFRRADRANRFDLHNSREPIFAQAGLNWSSCCPSVRLSVGRTRSISDGLVKVEWQLHLIAVRTQRREGQWVRQEGLEQYHPDQPYLSHLIRSRLSAVVIARIRCISASWPGSESVPPFIKCL